jgi:hypothetical protein
MGSKDPKWDLDREQPWHRMASHFFATGDTVKGVATKMDKSLPAVHNLLRQPWFQRRVTKLMAEAGARDISKLFHAGQFNSYSVITEIRDNPNSPAVLRLKAAQDLLDRSIGKATQRVELAKETVSDNLVEEYNRLERKTRSAEPGRNQANRLKGEDLGDQPLWPEWQFHFVVLHRGDHPGRCNLAALYSVKNFITPIPAKLEQGIWFIFLLLLIIYAITAFATGSVHPFR